MKDFLVNILPRIKAYSKELDITEQIIDKPWIWITNDGDNQKMVFRRGGDLLMINNGEVKTGSWEYIPALSSLLIDRTVDKLLMNHTFINESIMLLKRDGASANEILAFVNELQIPSLDYEKYLSNLANSTFEVRYTLPNNTLEEADANRTEFILLNSATNKTVNVFHDGVIVGETEGLPVIGKKIYLGNEILTDGYYSVPDNIYLKIPHDSRKDKMLYYVENGVVKEQFFLAPYRTYTKARRYINLFYKRWGVLQDSLVLYENDWKKVIDGKYNCALLTNIIVKDGRVVNETMF